MGYACPVCEIPQRDGEHLANHLAFTAMLRGGAHADWLDEHVSGWAETDPDALADRVTPHAEKATYDEVFEDTTDEHDHPEPAVGGLPDESGSPARGTPDEVMREARELTRRMYDDGSTDETSGADTAGDDSSERDGDAADADET